MSQVLWVALGGLLLSGCVTTHPMARVRSTRVGAAAYGPYLRGLMLERSAQLDLALEAYEQALQHDTDSPVLQVRIGATQLKLGQPEPALKHFQRALAMDPTHRDALRWIAMLYTSQGQLESAVRAYELLVEQNPSDAFVLGTLADLYVMEDKLPLATKLYERLIRAQGSSYQLHFNLGVLYGRIGDLDRSMEELSRAIELSPNAVEARIAMGLTQELAHRPAQAQAHYEEAIKLDPLNPRLYYHAARAAITQDHTADAIRYYETVLDLAPDDLDTMVALVRLWISDREYDKAQRFLAAKLETFGGHPELYLMLGLLYREAKAPYEALHAFEHAVELQDDSAQAHFYLGAQLERLDAKTTARQSFRRAIALDPNYADALNYLGYMDTEDGVNYDEARSMIERAVTLDPDNGAYLDSLGWLYYKMGNVDEAIKHLEAAAKLLDSDPIIFDHLGDVYLKHGDVAKAQVAWKKALLLDGQFETVRHKLDSLTTYEFAIDSTVKATPHNGPAAP